MGRAGGRVGREVVGTWEGGEVMLDLTVDAAVERVEEAFSRAEVTAEVVVDILDDLVVHRLLRDESEGYIASCGLEMGWCRG